VIGLLLFLDLTEWRVSWSESVCFVFEFEFGSEERGKGKVVAASIWKSPGRCNVA
jgi:hypothetical protein